MDTAVSPTKGNLMASKKTLELSRMGYELMDRKHSILVREMMGLINHANTLREKIDATYEQAYGALMQAQIAMGVCEEVARSVPVERGLSVSLRSVMGVELPTVRMEEQPLLPCYDFSVTTSTFDKAYIGFHEVKLMLVELAEVENSVYRLAVAIKKTQSRVGALKNIILPNLEETIRRITEALEEKEREEFSRLKVIKRVGEKR